MVKEILMRIGSDESDFERRKQLQAEVLASITGFSAGDRLDRDQTHDRDAVR